MADRCSRVLTEGDDEDQDQRGDCGGKRDSEVLAKFVFHRTALTIAGGDRRVGDEREIVPEHRASHHRCRAQREREARSLSDCGCNRDEERDRSDRSAHRGRHKAGDDKEDSDGEARRNQGEHQVGDTLGTASPDDADEGSGGQKDQEHRDDVLVPDALRHEFELAVK